MNVSLRFVFVVVQDAHAWGVEIVELAAPFSDQLESLLVQRNEEGIWDLRSELGQDLGLAVIDAQDFFAFCGASARASR